jgi:hypothetical protein
MQINLRSFFSPAAVANHLLALPVLQTFIMDLIYPNRPTHPFPVLGFDELTAINGNVPVVRRGTAAYALGGEGQKITYLEPQPVDISSFVTAADLNNLKLLGTTGTEQWVRNKVDAQRRVVRATTEALACQSLTGKISYPMKTDTGLKLYEVDFGSVLEFTIVKKWDHADTTVADILLDLINIGNKIKQTSGYGATIHYLAGQKTYVAVANKVLALPGDSKVAAKVTEQGINIGGFEIKLAQGGYTNLTNSAWVPAVTDHHVLAVAADAPWRLFYCALDDLDANLLPMPFYSKPVQKENPSGYEIIGMSKPVPVPVVKAICKGVATAA